MEKLKYKRFKVKIQEELESRIEYVEILDKVENKYLVVVVGEPSNIYKNGKAYKMDYVTGIEREIITPNKDKVFIVSPENILEMVNS
jgi:archaeosine-15-forming tRNA-guanine transglycosylase